MIEMKWKIKHFDELTTKELYDLLALRSEVFVVEQNCPYQDLDGKDLDGFHVLGYLDCQFVATARILKVGASYENEVSIGRVVSSPSIRGLKKGHELMETCMKFMNTKFPDKNIKISAQSHLVGYYSKHGFVKTNKDYLEDNIPHSEMIFNFK